MHHLLSFLASDRADYQHHHSLCQDNSTVVQYIGKVSTLIQELALTGHSFSLQEQNLYICCEIHLDLHNFSSSLTTNDPLVTISQLCDHMFLNLFIFLNDLVDPSSFYFTLVAQRHGCGP